MPYTFTAAASSRIQKPKPPKNPLASLGLRSNSQRKRGSSTKTAPSAAARKNTDKDDSDEDAYTERLEDHGLIASLAGDLNLSDVAQMVRHVYEHAFDEIPPRSGLNSTRTAEVLNFRRNLPPVVSVPHILALSTSHTTTEREIARLVRAGILKRMRIPGRGKGGSAAIGEGLVLCESLLSLLNSATSVDDDAKAIYTKTLKEYPEVLSIQAQIFTPREASQLSKAGFLTNASATQTGISSGATFASPDIATLGTLTSLSTIGSRAASGSVDAVGGANAVHSAGGGGAALSASERAQQGLGSEYLFSIPSMGPYLKLLQSSKDHLIRLLSQSSFREAPMHWLKEKWDGAAAVSSYSARRDRKTSALAAPLMPAKTRKWKQFYGLRFEWVLEECLGTGLVEVFQTGSVGLGVRLV